MSNDYWEKYDDPRWREKRERILERDRGRCQACYTDEGEMHVHHQYYRWDSDPWDYPDSALITICKLCHERETPERREARRALVEAVFTHARSEDVKRLATALESLFRSAGGHQIEDLVEWVELLAEDEEVRAFVFMRAYNRSVGHLGVA